MYCKIKTKGIASFDVEIDPIESLYEIKAMLGFGRQYGGNSIGIVDGVLKSSYDISYHGSPCYEYSVISDKQEDIDAYRAMNLLIRYCETKFRCTK